MEFRFNFQSERECETEQKEEGNKSQPHLRACIDHTFSASYPRDTRVVCHEFDGKVLKHLDPCDVSTTLRQKGVLQCTETSDLQSGEYEGGLTVWECTYDLLNYLQRHKELMCGKKVLDLGCGAGILGTYTWLSEAKFVCLQDYNAEVIENFTMATVGLSTEGNTNYDSLKFISGDWDNVNKYFADENYPKFDLILSAETIYNKQYYSKLLRLLTTHLDERGMALFAAKSYYFGVDGGTMEFCRFLLENGNFDVETVVKFDEGLSRELIQISKTYSTIFVPCLTEYKFQTVAEVYILFADILVGIGLL